MIRRIVKMTFREEETENFLAFFDTVKERISGFEGCHHLELWQDKRQKNICFTYSLWESEEALDHYRYSELFKNTWSKTKVLFKDKAEAWSLDRIYQSSSK